MNETRCKLYRVRDLATQLDDIRQNLNTGMTDPWTALYSASELPLDDLIKEPERLLTLVGTSVLEDALHAWRVGAGNQIDNIVTNGRIYGRLTPEDIRELATEHLGVLCHIVDRCRAKWQREYFREKIQVLDDGKPDEPAMIINIKGRDLPDALQVIDEVIRSALFGFEILMAMIDKVGDMISALPETQHDAMWKHISAQSWVNMLELAKRDFLKRLMAQPHSVKMAIDQLPMNKNWHRQANELMASKSLA